MPVARSAVKAIKIKLFPFENITFFQNERLNSKYFRHHASRSLLCRFVMSRRRVSFLYLRWGGACSIPCTLRTPTGRSNIFWSFPADFFSIASFSNKASSLSLWKTRRVLEPFVTILVTLILQKVSNSSQGSLELSCGCSQTPFLFVKGHTSALLKVWQKCAPWQCVSDWKTSRTKVRHCFKSAKLSARQIEKNCVNGFVVSLILALYHFGVCNNIHFSLMF